MPTGACATKARIASRARRVRICVPRSGPLPRARADPEVATEAGAEGINLQFCSLVVNYDLPWNPQRIEQRIGRCHRYGQKHDVVVVNFLNRKKRRRSTGLRASLGKVQAVRGRVRASDEVLGAIESGVDFEKRIAAIYQQMPKDGGDSGRVRSTAAGAGLRDQRHLEQGAATAPGELRRRGAREVADAERIVSRVARPVRTAVDGAD